MQASLRAAASMYNGTYVCGYVEAVDKDAHHHVDETNADGKLVLRSCFI